MGAEHRIIARFVMQAQGPLMIAGGADDPLHDISLVRDVNGLPVLPATGIAGALRALAGTEANAWFGTAEMGSEKRSPLTLTDGLFHWSDDAPRDGLLLDRTALEADMLCKAVLPDAPILRDHVRLNDLGAVDGDGKFDRSAVPAGARFTFELRGQDAAIVKAVSACVRGGLWLGGAGRSGYGEMACVAEGQEPPLDLRVKTDRDRYAVIAGCSTGKDSPIAVTYQDQGRRKGAMWTLAGQIEGPLLVGAPPRTGKDEKGNAYREDRAPWREQRIVWDGHAGAVRPDVWVVPASAIKGPLRHRTLYHLRKTAGLDKSEADAALVRLFGDASGKTGGRAGSLRFRDVVPEDAQVVTQTHVGLDRFTGGARRGVLFTDAMLWRPMMTIEIEETRILDETARTAFAKALEDMSRGLCGIGAEWGEGAGVFAKATVTPPGGIANAA